MASNSSSRESLTLGAERTPLLPAAANSRRATSPVIGSAHSSFSLGTSVYTNAGSMSLEPTEPAIPCPPGNMVHIGYEQGTNIPIFDTAERAARLNLKRLEPLPSSTSWLRKRQSVRRSDAPPGFSPIRQASEESFVFVDAAAADTPSAPSKGPITPGTFPVPAGSPSKRSLFSSLARKLKLKKPASKTAISAPVPGTLAHVSPVKAQKTIPVGQAAREARKAKVMGSHPDPLRSSPSDE